MNLCRQTGHRAALFPQQWVGAPCNGGEQASRLSKGAAMNSVFANWAVEVEGWLLSLLPTCRSISSSIAALNVVRAQARRVRRSLGPAAHSTSVVVEWRIHYLEHMAPRQRRSA